MPGAAARFDLVSVRVPGPGHGDRGVNGLDLCGGGAREVPFVGVQAHGDGLWRDLVGPHGVDPAAVEQRALQGGQRPAAVAALLGVPFDGELTSAGQHEDWPPGERAHDHRNGFADLDVARLPDPRARVLQQLEGQGHEGLPRVGNAVPRVIDGARPKQDPPFAVRSLHEQGARGGVIESGEHPRSGGGPLGRDEVVHRNLGQQRATTLIVEVTEGRVGAVEIGHAEVRRSAHGVDLPAQPRG